MNFVKRMVGSGIISFGILFVLVLMLSSLQVDAPKNVMLYLGGAWVLLTIAIYPWARKLVRV